MSDLPQIDTTKVVGKLTAKISELVSQNSHLEVLAEALRDQRDILQIENTGLREQLDAKSAE